MLRNMICWVMLAITPATVLAADPGGGMLYGVGEGTVWLNGARLPHSSAVFPGDLIQTDPDSAATLDAFGSGLIIPQDSRVKFETNAVSLEHGGVSVATSRRMIARAGAVTVTPVANTWTEFEVTDKNGAVQVVASKGEVNVSCGKDTATLSEGEEATRDSSGNCKKKRKGGVIVPGSGGILTDPYVMAATVIGGGAIICILLCTTSNPFLSQWKP
jgi:hypothetical protein